MDGWQLLLKKKKGNSFLITKESLRKILNVMLLQYSHVTQYNEGWKSALMLPSTHVQVQNLAGQDEDV